MGNTGNSLKYHIPTGKWTTKDFVLRAGISRTTLQRLRSLGVVTPDVTHVGRLDVYLYDATNLQQVIDYQEGE